MPTELTTWAGLRQPVSALTHLLFLPLLLYVTALLWRLSRNDRSRQWSLTCFGLSACLLYGISGAFHAVHGSPKLTDTLRCLDLSAIYVLIAGTCTPLMVLLFQGRRRNALIILLWSVALVGVIGKWLFKEQSYALTVGLYFVVATLGGAPVIRMKSRLGVGACLNFVLGGLFYAVGGICDVLQWPTLIPGTFQSHELLHVMDLAGTTTHVVFIAPIRGANQVNAGRDFRSCKQGAFVIPLRRSVGHRRSGQNCFITI